MKSNLYIVAFTVLAASIPTSAQETKWLTDYDKAIEQAKSQNKVILVDFTGSDWCGWCMKMKQETLDTPQFKSYSRKNLVLLEVDFPRGKAQTEQEKQQNQKLQQQFQVRGYPCFVLLDKDGKELGRQGGYLKGGPAAFIATLNTFYKPASSSSERDDDFHSFFKKPVQSPTP